MTAVDVYCMYLYADMNAKSVHDQLRSLGRVDHSWLPQDVVIVCQLQFAYLN